MTFVRSLKIVLGILALVVVVTTLELHYLRLPSVDITTRILIFGVLTINVLALLTLMFFVCKSLFKLYAERQLKVLGYRFRTKLVIIFGVLVLIPSASLFFFASGLATNYMNRITSSYLIAPLNESVELARSFYDLGRQRMLSIARDTATERRGFSKEVSVKRYTVRPKNEGELVREAFRGKEGTEIVSTERGDFVRAAVPVVQNGRVIAVTVAETVIPREISERTGRLRDLLEEFLKIESFRQPIQLNYVLILGFVTLLMVFAGLWVALRISRGITVPIQSLAMATEQVAAGNLDIVVTEKSEDEIGLLIVSFNQMIRQLKEGKVSLERAYRESDRRRLYLENIIENIESGVLFLDNDGKLLALNRAACSIMGVQTADLVGRDARELVDRLQSEDLGRMVRAMEGKRLRGVRNEVRINVDGRISVIRVHVAAIRETEASRSHGLVVVFDDITEVIRAQRALVWQEMARRLAHEIKNPLTPIKLSTERLIKKWHERDEHFDTVFEKSTKIIISEVESLRKLVDVFSRYGRMPMMHKVPTDLLGLIDAVVALYKSYGAVEIAVSADGPIPLVELDPEQFKRVLMNIIDNAVKVMNQQGSITISVASNDQYVIIEIADTGPGIPDEEKDKLFLPYFSKTKGGTGLGLAIASKVMSDHEGTIAVSDNKPRGSVFTLELPRVQAVEE